MPSDPFEIILALCIRRIEDEGLEALESVCVQHPEHAERLRDRVRYLGAANLVGDDAPDGGRDVLVTALLECLEKTGAERDAHLEELCARHPKRATEIRAHMTELAAMADSDSSAEVERIGPYKLLGILGEGGMGTVYLAEQKEPVRRRVALKVIKLGMNSKQVLARFELERQALAVMSHPTIAKVFDAGVTGGGQPYFVMELVEGMPIDEYCDLNRLSIEERIAVFQEVCNGVQHAHQKGVMHRDLKPSNVLVSLKGDQHIVKIIDFGLARATDHQLVEHTVFTEMGQLIGTPEYMSPEQASGASLDIDTRTDVYSLGVVLYQLLTGQLPFDALELRRAGLIEIQRIIQEVDPAKPSSRVSTLGDQAVEWAANRGFSVPALRRRLERDLDWIIMRALAKEPARRYESATSLAQDLQRFLDHDPVLAGPPGLAYRVSKIARKYRVQVVAAGLLVSSLVAGAISTTWFMFDARAHQADARANETEARNMAIIAGQRAEDAERERENARSQARRATAENTRFRRVSVVVQLEVAKKELARLQPAWPEMLPAMDAWLRNRLQRLQEALPLVQSTLAELRERARSPSVEEAEADRRNHPKYGELLTVEKKLESLRRAMAVRNGTRQPEIVELPADTTTDVRALLNRAWPKVSPHRELGAFGEEPTGLALARRALASAKQNNWVPRATLAWALFANGLDEQAEKTLMRALEVTPDEMKRRIQDQVEAFRSRRARAADTLAETEKKAAALRVATGKRQTWRFSEDADTFLHRTLTEVEPELVTFLAEDGPRAEMQRRVAWAKRIEELSTAHPRARVTWDDARRALRTADGAVASKLYAAELHDRHPIELPIQLGLVPIGMNPVTKLWEFYHLRSAVDPAADVDPGTIEIPTHRRDGSIDVKAGTGIVFVLLPGTFVSLGAQKDDSSDWHYDPQALPQDYRHMEDVRPFFLARHEVTQGQWMRLSGGANPSQLPVGMKVPAGTVTPAHPVDSVDWHVSTSVLENHGLVLPSEAEWEYGCRAGTTSVWFTGNDADSLKGAANLFDEFAVRQGIDQANPVPFSDGRAVHAPVGTYRANGFGLFDVHGNVFEWCRDPFVPGSSLRVPRGGSFNYGPQFARSACRYSYAPSIQHRTVGLRAARQIRQ